MEDWAGVEKLHQFNRNSDTPQAVSVESYDNMSSGTVAIFPRQSSSPSLPSTCHCLIQQLPLFALILLWSLCVGRVWRNVPTHSSPVWQSLFLFWCGTNERVGKDNNLFPAKWTLSQIAQPIASTDKILLQDNVSALRPLAQLEFSVHFKTEKKLPEEEFHDRHSESVGFWQDNRLVIEQE